MTNDFRRKLAAILCADIAGYSQLMRGDEEGTRAAYKACFDDVIAPALTMNRGHLVKGTGDGFIAVFDSVVESVACALAIQDGIARKGHGCPFAFRIGVNIGDIIEEDEDVFGDGVNLADRLQSRAAPGGVCVSELVRDHLKGKLKVEFESLGRKRVKKNDVPFKAYAVRAESAGLPQSRLSRIGKRSHRVFANHSMIGFAAAAVCVATLVVWQPGVVKTLDIAGLVTGKVVTALPLPDRPSLVVLPFKNIGAAPEQEYFADGITEDVITELSRISGLFVIATHSSFAYKTRTRDVREIGRNLGVRYALDGSVRRSNDKVRIVAQLVDAKNGNNIWAARYDRPIGDVFKIQDEITEKIVTALAVTLEAREQGPPAGMQTGSIVAYDAYLRGWAAYRANTFEQYQKAIKYFQSAIAFDPGFTRAHAALAATYLNMRQYVWTRVESFDSPVDIVLNSVQLTESLLKKARTHLALALRNPTAFAYRTSAELSIFDRDHDKALEDVRTALALDPNDADNFAALSSILVWSGQPQAAIEPIQRAMRLNPFYPPIYLCHYGSALFSLGRYAESADKFEQCRAGNPENLWPYIYLIASYAYLGKDAKAAEARQRAIELLQKQDRSLFTVGEVRNRMRYRYRADLLRLLVGLHKGKVPDTLF